MICPKCKTEMVIGEAIKPNWEYGAMYVIPPPLITFETMQIIPCWKCPQCGHSNDGR